MRHAFIGKKRERRGGRREARDKQRVGFGGREQRDCGIAGQVRRGGEAAQRERETEDPQIERFKEEKTRGTPGLSLQTEDGFYLPSVRLTTFKSPDLLVY